MVLDWVSFLMQTKKANNFWNIWKKIFPLTQFSEPTYTNFLFFYKLCAPVPHLTRFLSTLGIVLLKSQIKKKMIEIEYLDQKTLAF